MIAIALAAGAFYSASGCAEASAEELRYSYPDIFDISYTPDTLHRCTGWFTDAGAWFGFTPPEKEAWVNGFCGPFSLDMNRRQWLAKSAVAVLPKEGGSVISDSLCYYPGELRLCSEFPQGKVEQHLNFVNSGSAILSIVNESGEPLVLKGVEWAPEIKLRAEGNNVVASHPSGETVVLTFSPDVEVTVAEDNYRAVAPGRRAEYVVISMFDSDEALHKGLVEVESLVNNPEAALATNGKRWDGYLKKTLRDGMPPEYDRIAVKAITTLVSNHRAARGGLLHDGIIPSHAVGYFVGLWAWDSWRFCAGAASFDPELAKNNIRAMFDYQLPDGMIIDCIYTDPTENNARNSKPPLVAWAVDKIYDATGDKAFLAEMYPQLMAYYKWWYKKRDHDHNGICEYGATDGTLEAAAWESGMDNAIRFDDTQMLSNGSPEAWSMNQESVDLNAYLANECKYLKKFATILGEEFDAPDHTSELSGYFYDPERRFFFDRTLDGQFVGDPGCEAYTMLWTGLATPEQVEEMMPVLQDTTKFSTYIPFPTVAADNPKYNPRGYWRGPIWLDQTYFAISGLRNYGYGELADDYTRRVFERLEGLNEGGPIHENYDTHTGKCLKAPHFSWSASHLIMLYNEYGK
ncbi:MAG: glycoside hydrolase [Muribaculaceae bacterium]|nr:glycoside hydrolase [Muribaculaceae bacterium]